MKSLDDNGGAEAASDGVAAVDRALAILSAISAQSQAVTLADMARATGFYKSTLLRLLASLERGGLVTRQADGRYMLGPFSYQLGLAYEASHHLTAVLRPLFERLVERHTESPSFHVFRDAAHRLCLLRLDSEHSTVDRIRAGDLLPLDRGAPGRLLSTYVVQGLEPSVDDLLFVSIGERDPNCAAIACPVFGPAGSVLGALSLSGPKERFTKDAIARMERELIQAAMSATTSLGGDWPR